MKYYRYLLLVMALILAALAAPALAGAAVSSQLKTYTAPNGEWSAQYPADLLHVEQLNENVTIFISKDRHTVAAVDVSVATANASKTALIGRGQATLRQIYGKPVKNAGELSFAGARWETGFRFATDKGSKGAALYHQNGRVDGDYRIFGFVYGYKANTEKTMRPILEAIEGSLRIYPPAPKGIDWVCVSPKADAPLVQTSGQELKLVYPQAAAMPERFEQLNFERFYLQPMDNADREANTQRAVAYCLSHPRWRLSVQTHKYIGVP